ncbi:MAG TPA: STAS-like domain-containing protein [Candidatus Acidoferrum sp.]|nr:STAS-like domain-containing protein [Candidatus Acidoferrum sp.]
MIASRLDLSIAKEFTEFPGPRKRTEGEFSGEQFLAELLRPRFVAARDAGASLFVELDGAAGYPTSFLEEAFGGLAREFGVEEVRRVLEIHCADEPYLVDQIWKYVDEATTRK